MKHLKRFNESNTEDSIMDLCNEYLAYLKDAGFEFRTQVADRIYKQMNANCIVINKTGKSGFYWSLST